MEIKHAIALYRKGYITSQGLIAVWFNTERPQEFIGNQIYKRLGLSPAAFYKNLEKVLQHQGLDYYIESRRTGIVKVVES